MCFSVKKGQILESCTLDCHIGWAGYQTSFYATDQITKILINNKLYRPHFNTYRVNLITLSACSMNLTFKVFYVMSTDYSWSFYIVDGLFF